MKNNKKNLESIAERVQTGDMYQEIHEIHPWKSSQESQERERKNLKIFSCFRLYKFKNMPGPSLSSDAPAETTGIPDYEALAVSFHFMLS